jgi:hypothetical protein
MARVCTGTPCGLNIALQMGGEAIRSNGAVDAGSKLPAVTLLAPIFIGRQNVVLGTFTGRLIYHIIIE